MKTIAIASALPLFVLGCRHSPPPTSTAAETARLEQEPAKSPDRPLRPLPGGSARPGEHPRLLLTRERLERARRNALAGAPAFLKAEEECTEAQREPQRSGYEGWDWGGLLASCALSWRITGKEQRAATAIRYFRALLDDRERVGDGKGGDRVVEHDHGYPIRTHAFFAALGYDWLYDAPGMTPELRSHASERLERWLSWYERDGYRRDDPIANYFTGYFGALALAGLATAGETRDGDELLRKAEELFEAKVVPSYKKLLVGGDWPEGWQYGDGAVTVMALFLDGERTALGRDRFAELPWLREVVHHHVHAILPDGVHAYDNGDWTEHPPKMPSRALEAVAMVLPDGDPDGASARFLARELRDPKDDWSWIQLLSDGPKAPVRDPREGKMSFVAGGTGLMLARSAWRPDATFVSLQSGPTIPDADHQHTDQGHFEVTRGADALLVDAGDYKSFATINHNSILVDDHGKGLDYAPNQGTWGRDSKIGRFVDAGDYVFAEGDFTDAYRPAKLEWGVKRSVLRAERALTFVRPGVVVLYDRVTVADPAFDVTWISHSLSRPSVSGPSFTVRKGSSAAVVTTLLPSAAEAKIVAETPNDDRSVFVTNATWTETFRAEVRAPRARDVRFLTVIQTGRSDLAALPTARIDGDRVDGAVIGLGEGAIAIVYPKAGPTLDAAGGSWELPAVGRQVVVGLSPGGRYAVRSEDGRAGCRVTIRPAQEGQGIVADDGGTLLVRSRGCTVR